MITGVKEIGSLNDDILEVTCVHDWEGERTERIYHVFNPSNILIIKHVGGGIEFLSNGTMSEGEDVMTDIKDCHKLWNAIRYPLD